MWDFQILLEAGGVTLEGGGPEPSGTLGGGAGRLWQLRNRRGLAALSPALLPSAEGRAEGRSGRAPLPYHAGVGVARVGRGNSGAGGGGGW